MPRFTLRDVFWCVTLVALGAAEIGAIMRHSHRPGDTGLTSWLMLGSVALIGTAVGALFGRPILGFILGFLIGATVTSFWVVVEVSAMS